MWSREKPEICQLRVIYTEVTILSLLVSSVSNKMLLLGAKGNYVTHESCTPKCEELYGNMIGATIHRPSHDWENLKLSFESEFDNP